MGIKDMLGDTPYQADRYPQRPGHVAGSPTSQAAADAIDAKRLTGLRARVYAHILTCGGCTDEQGMAALGMEPNTYRPRRRELELLGYIRDSGRTMLTRSGRDAVVWEARG